MIERKLTGMSGEMSVRHREPGTHLSCHCLQIYVPNERIVLSVEDAKNLVELILCELPAEYSPEAFRIYLLGKPFDEYWQDRTKLSEIASSYGLTWEELHECLKGSKESAEAREGEDEARLWIEHEGNTITDVIWG